MKLARFTNSTTPASLSGKHATSLSRCILSVLCVSVVSASFGKFTTETQSSQKSHRGLKLFRQTAVRFLIIVAFLTVPTSFYSAAVPQSAPNIGVNGSLSANKTQRGRTVQGTVVMDIPSGYHVNSSQPLEKFLIPTQVKVEAPKGIRVGPVSYPRAVLRSFKFSKNRVSVYEGRATMRFNIVVPRDVPTGSREIKVRLRYQSCNDEVCFPPQSRELSLWLNVE
jgi:DsbC/DsbD-like thiol-disulfide interchange protein